MDHLQFQGHDANPCLSGYGYNGNLEMILQVFGLDGNPCHVHHVERQDHRISQVLELGQEKNLLFELTDICHIHDQIRLPFLFKKLPDDDALIL